jgi:putative glutamine amidotransferase
MMPGLKTFGSALALDDYFGPSVAVAQPEDIKKIDALIIWGGEDISPSYYKQFPMHTHAPETPSLRDRQEEALIKEAVRVGKPILGVCRGAQLLCALHGGSLWQHVNGHSGAHTLEVTTRAGRYIGRTNSVHHQMMRPDPEAEILGWVPKQLSPKKYGQALEPESTDEVEVEIAWFPKFRALGVQGHPEWLERTSFLSQLTKQLFEEKTNERYSWY